MSVGNQATKAEIDQTLTNLALQMRNLMGQVKNLNTQVNGQGNGLTYLEGIGYTAGDAATAQTMVSYLNTVAGCYFGTVQQGGTGGTGAIDFSFDNALSVLWAAG